ncbi:MAG: serine/threonine-protein kinase [Burkholderiaceae bacterium]
MNDPVSPVSGERAVLELFERALDVDAGERDAWVVQQCAGDATLLARVRRLVAIDQAESSGLFAADGHGTQLTGGEPWAAVLPPPRVGVWRLDELIGSGGMGAVYRATRADGLFEQTVAVKFVRPLRGLMQIEPLVDAERRLLARMQHPGIAHIVDGGTTANGLHFLVMEFVDGRALDEWVADQAPAARTVVGLMREVCAAVAHAHSHLVLHCDIKPANILVTAAGEPKLIDFGVARIQDVIDASLPQGFTRAYTSPQRLAGEPASVSDDVYSLGMVLAEVLTGTLPDPHALELAAPLDAELAAVIGKALAPERAARYARVEALDDDLARWLASKPVSALGDHWRYRARKLVQRHPWRVASATLALGGLVASLVIITGLYNRAEASRRDAEKRFDEVRALATYMLFDLDARLEATPGNTAARREMVGRSQHYLDALAQSAQDRPALQREVAVGLARLAEVQGVPGRPHVGEPAAARQNLERAAQLLAAQDWTWHRDVGHTQYLLALLVGGRDNDPAGELERARRAEQSVLRALELASDAPVRDQAALHELLSSTRLTQADAHRSLDQQAQAAALQSQEEQRLYTLPEAMRAQMAFEFQSGRAALMLGDSLYYLERKSEALQAYQRGTQRFRAGLERAPTNRRLLLGALMGNWYISSVMAELNQAQAALAPSDEAMRIAQQMLALDPENLEALRMLNSVRNDRAMVLARLGRHDEAIALTEQSMPEKEARAARAPDDSERARDIAVPLRLLASYYRDKGDRDGACRVLRRALQAWGAIDKRWGLSDFDRRNDVEEITRQLARCPAARE